MGIEQDLLRLDEIAREIQGIKQRMSEYFPCATPEEPEEKSLAIINKSATAGTDSVEISWTVLNLINGFPIGATGQVCYGTTTALGQVSTLEPNYIPNHTQTITGLNANTTYFYTVKSETLDGRYCESEIMQFTTGVVTDKVFPAESTGDTPTPVSCPALPGPGQTIVSGDVEITCLVEGEQHFYSRRFAYNADNTKYLTETNGFYDLYNVANPNSPIDLGQVSGNELHFDANDPNKFYGMVNGVFTTFTCGPTGIISTTPSSATGDYIGPFEGSISPNGIVAINSGGSLGGGGYSGGQIEVWNINTNTQISSIATPSGMDWAAVSTLGNYVVADVGSTAIVYDVTTGNQLYTFGPSVGHSEFAIDCNGNEVLVYFGGGGTLYVQDLANPNNSYALPYTNLSSAGHVSYSPAQPGYIYGSFYTSFSPGEGFVGRVELCPNSTTHEKWTSLCHTSYDYIDQPQASVNPDGEGLLFTTAVNGQPTTYLVSCA